MATSSDSRDLIDKGRVELKIPGFDKYTIDTNLVCRSYNGRSVKKLKLSHRNYHLYRSSEHYKFRPSKLLYCAQNGIDPSMLNGEVFVITKDGEVMEKTEFLNSVHLTDKNRLPINGHKTKKSAIERLNQLRHGITAQRKSILTGDRKYIYDYLVENKKGVLNMTARSVTTGGLRKELKQRFDELALLVADHYVTHMIVKANLMVSGENAMRKLLKDEQEHRKKTLYGIVEYGMTDEGMYKQ